MSRKLTEGQIRQYRDEGFVFPVAVLTSGEASECHRRFEALRHMNEDNRDDTMVLFMKPHLVFPWLDDLVRHPGILDAVEDLIGPDILLYSDSFIVKEPHTQGTFSMHQDRWRWKLEPMEVVNCWLAFTHSNGTNGCMKMVPQSHRNGELPHEMLRNQDNVISYGQTVTCIDTSKPVDLVLAPGEMSMHDSGTVHGSQANLSPRGRPLLVNGYASADAFPFFRQAPSMTSKYEGVIVRGKPAKYAHVEAMNLRVPPDWSGGYSSIFED